MIDMWWELLLPEEKEQIVLSIKKDMLSKHTATCPNCRIDNPCGAILPVVMLVEAMEAN